MNRLAVALEGIGILFDVGLIGRRMKRRRGHEDDHFRRPYGHPDPKIENAHAIEGDGGAKKSGWLIVVGMDLKFVRTPGAVDGADIVEVRLQAEATRHC